MEKKPTIGTFCKFIALLLPIFTAIGGLCGYGWEKLFIGSGAIAAIIGLYAVGELLEKEEGNDRNKSNQEENEKV